MLALETIQKFSGILSIIIVWIVLVGYPFFYRDLGYLQETITTLSGKKRNVFVVITVALLTGCFFQMYFLVYMDQKFSLGLTSFGALLYLSMGAATFIATICNARFLPGVHFWSAAYYFVVAPIAVALLGYEAHAYNQDILAVSVALSAVYIIGNFFMWLRFRKTNATFEIWSFLVLSVWTIYMTFV